MNEIALILSKKQYLLVGVYLYISILYIVARFVIKR